MKKVEFNKSNWSGEKTFVKYSEGKKTFTIESMPEYKFKLVSHSFKDDPDLNYYHIEGNDWERGYSFGIVSEHKGMWYAMQGSAIEREDANLYVAAAKLLCNLI